MTHQAPTTPPTQTAEAREAEALDRARLVRDAALALLGHSALLLVALVALFARAADPWGWSSMIALVCIAFGIAAAVLVWRLPSRVHLAAGAGVLLLSLLRCVGAPLGWSALLSAAVTLALLVPVLRALRRLLRDA